MKQDSTQIQESEKKQERVVVSLISGVEGQCVSINDYRICGSKPRGGDSVERSWTTTKEDVLRAFLTPNQEHYWLSKELAIIPVGTVNSHDALVKAATNAVRLLEEDVDNALDVVIGLRAALAAVKG